MAEFVGGAALGAAFGELFAVCREAVRTTANFRPALKLLHNTLSDNQAVINEIMKLDRCLGRVPENSNLSILLTRGQKLVVECSGVRPWNLFGWLWYSIKLKQLNESLLRFFQIDEQAQISTDNREILLLVKQIRSSMNGGISRVRSIPGPPKHVVGFEEPLEEVKKKLLCGDDETSPLVVVLSALGGQGKTTLAKMICHDNQISELFEGNIFFVTFSEKPKVEVIVRKLIRAMGYPEPYEFATVEDAIHELEKSVSGIIGAKHVLLVLDDVWSESEDFLEKFEFPVKGLKILVTSRSRFRKYEKNTYYLRVLDEDDSMKLFCKLAFPNGKDHEMPDDLVSKVVKGCRGFPLALEVVASSLRRLPIEMWNEWSRSNNNCNDDLLDCLQRSVDVLDKLGDHIKDCYQDLALFPEDERIPVASLSDMWAELYDIDLGKTLVNLHELSLRNLVDLVSNWRDNDIDRIELTSNEHYVTQHDVLRELVNRQSNRDPVHERVRLNLDISSDSPFDWPTDQPLNARIVSFSTDESHPPNWENGPRNRPRKSNSRVPRFMVWFVSLFLTIFQSFRSFFNQTYLDLFRANFSSLKLPKTEALLLNIRSQTYSFPQFLNGMPQLKALVITNHGFHPSELHDFWVPSRLPSLRRIRLVHVSLSSFDASAVIMKNLRKISLSMCRIGNALENHLPCEKPIVDLPNLTEIEIDCCYDLTKLPSELCDLVHVTKLRITNCQALIELPRELGKMRNLKELRLYSCTKLSELPESIGDLRELEFLDISECIGVEALPERIGELRGLRKLNVRGCTGLKRLPESIRNLHESLEVVCDEEVLCLWNNFDGQTTNRKIKVVHRENSLNYLRL